MTSPFLSCLNLNKLGHKLEEIRVRALNNVISKLDLGLTDEGDLTTRRELLGKLLEWFNFETCPEKEKVLQLILRLLKTSRGKCLLSQVSTQHVLPMFTKLQIDADPKLHILIDEIKIGLIGGTRVTDVALGVPNESEVGPVASPIEVFWEEQSSEEQLEQPSSNPTYQENIGYFPSRQNVSSALLQNCFPHLFLPWQPLVATDRHVLTTVEESLSNLTDSGLVHHTCQFFSEVMLQDFPSEIFIQRPSIVKIFLDILESNPPGSNTQLCMAMMKCLHKLTAAIYIRVQYYTDPSFANLKQEMCTANSQTASYLSAASELTVNSTDYLHNCHIMPEDMEGQCHEHDHDSEITVELKKTVNVATASQVKHHNDQLNTASEAGCFTESDSEDSVLMQLQQFSLPQFALLALYQAISHQALPLAFDLVKLVNICITPSIWLCTDTMAIEIAKSASQVLELIGEIVEQHMRINSTGEEHRLLYLQLLALCRLLLHHLVPVEQGHLLIPQKLKNAIVATLLDYPLICLHSSLHKDLLNYGKAFTGRHKKGLQCYTDTMTICKSMAASVKFLKVADKLEGYEVLRIIDETLPSLTFHKNLSLVKTFVEMYVKKMHRWQLDENTKDKATTVILNLLSHSELGIKRETYAGCHKCVVAILGVDSMQRCGGASQLTFIFNPAILTEIACHGITSTDTKIKQYSCEMITYLLKGNVLMSAALWQSFLESLIPVLPLLQCFAEKSSILGRAVAGMLDPDMGIAISLPVIEILTGNLRLLFSADNLVRDEAVSRLIWLLTHEPRSHEKLPDLAALVNNTLGQICLVNRPLDLTRPRKLQSYYHVDSMCQVVDLLGTVGVEPQVRRSALTQISVMLEDTELHIPFLEKAGIEIILIIFQNALIEKEFHNYPDSVVPIVNILRNLCLHSSKLRQQLAQQSSVYYCILRALFLFINNERLRHEAAQLLCLLLFFNFILSVPELPELKNEILLQYPLSLPEVVVKHMQLPFVCHTHWKTSHHTQPTFRGILSNDACQAMLRLCWTSEWFGGVLQMLDSQDEQLNEEIMFKFSPELKATETDLEYLKATAISYCCKYYLYNIQNSTTHEAVSISMKKMSGYILLNLLLKENDTADGKDCWKDLPWEGTLSRFLGTSPVCPEDENLLLELLQFLHLCIKSLTPADMLKPQWSWVLTILKDSSQPLPNLLRMDLGTASKDICREVFVLCQQCCILEIQAEELEKINYVTGSWVHIVETIAQNLKFSDTQHFYNLAFLDWMLTCLTHLTSYSGWSKSSRNASQLVGELTSCLTELIPAFHCSKGGKTGTSLASLMGISITRSAILCMNHVLCELQNLCGKKGWESLWVNSLINGDSHQMPDLSWLASLWLSRDPIVRAAALQLVAGFCCTHYGSRLMIRGLRLTTASIWEVGFGFLLDHSEASVVREQAAVMLTNLISHISSHSIEESSFSLGPIVSEQVVETDIQALLSLLDQSNLFGEVWILASRLYVGTTVVPGGYVPAEKWIESSSGNEISPTNLQTDQFVLVYNPSQGDEPSSSITGSTAMTEGTDYYIVTTPSLIRAVCWLLVSLLSLSQQDVLHNINKFGIIRILFRSISGVPKEVNDSQSLLLYMDVLEMYTGVCSVLGKCVTLHKECHSTALRTQDCLNTLLTLLDPALYHTHLPQLMFLRNRLWSQVFRLLSSMLNGHGGYQAVTEVLFNYGHGPFFATLETSISGKLSSELWNSALSSLTSLLSQETQYAFKRPRPDMEDLHKVTSLQSVLDECPSEPTQPAASGAQLCALLLHLYDVQSLKNGSGDGRRPFSGGKTIIISALTSLLAVSREAKRFALAQGLLETILVELRELHVRLSVQPVDNLQKILDKKKVSPVVQELSLLFSLLTNFLYDASTVKITATGVGLADLLHKLWVWCCRLPSLLADILRLLCTYTTDHLAACQSLVLTSTIPGVGLRKSPSSLSLLHEVVSLVLAETEVLNKAQDSIVLPLVFHLLKNASHAQECRVVLCKGNLFSGICNLYTPPTKKQKSWKQVQIMWLDFLIEFTYYQEGQLAIPKVTDAVEIFILLSECQKSTTRKMALTILRNIAFHQLNRSRLLASRSFLQLLNQTLSKGSLEEKSLIAEMLWALVANNQKAKLIVKNSGIADKLKEAENHLNIMNRHTEDYERIGIFRFVLNIINTQVNRTKQVEPL